MVTSAAPSTTLNIHLGPFSGSAVTAPSSPGTQARLPGQLVGSLGSQERPEHRREPGLLLELLLKSDLFCVAADGPLPPKAQITFTEVAVTMETGRPAQAADG